MSAYTGKLALDGRRHTLNVYDVLILFSSGSWRGFGVVEFGGTPLDPGSYKTGCGFPISPIKIST